MKTLNFEQMEKVNGGQSVTTAIGDSQTVDISLGCVFGIAAFCVAAGSLVLASGGTAAVLFAGIGYSIAPAGAALACK